MSKSQYYASFNSIRFCSIAECGSEDFDDFLGVLGEQITLKGWERFRGGLDVKGMSYDF